MRIIHFVSSDKISGLEILSMNMLSEMSGEHEVYYSCPEGDGIKRASELGLGTIVCDTRSPGAIKRVVKKYKPDAIHAHDPAVSLSCALSGVKFVSHLHSNCFWMKKLCPNSIALTIACAKAQKIICVSESIVKEYIFSGLFKKKITVLGNYVDADFVKAASLEACNEKYDISFVGRLIDQKQPVKFVRIIKKIAETLPEVKAVMVGDGELRREVENKISEFGLEDNITLIGFDINPHRFVNNSKVGVLTSKYEGFGLVAVEAMILGKPFVAFPAGGLVNIVNDENGKLCTSDEDMAEEIVRLLTDAEYYNKKSASAKESSKAFTDKKAYVKKIIEYYKN